MIRWASLACLIALTACATSHVLVGTQRPPVPIESVRVYLDPPPQFEKVAILESSSEGSFALTSQQKTNKVLARLKAEAASLGANGILMQGIGTGSRGAVVNTYGNAYGSNYVGTGVAVPVMVKEGTALAIYVTDPGTATARPLGTQPTPSNSEQTVPQSRETCVSCQKIGKDF